MNDPGKRALAALVLAAAAAAMATTGGCTPPHHCDPGQIDMGYACYSPPDAGASDSGGGMVDVIPPDSVMCTDQYTGFGYACNAATDCPCGLDFCVIFGGQTYCTKTGCQDDPSVCPQGYTCVDFGAYSPGLGPTCARM
jgi:hypothetical protein